MLAPVLVASILLAAAGVGAQPARPPLPLEPGGDRGEAIFPALEGWYRNADGGYNILLGYFNRNAVPVDLPIGPDNRIEPGGPDLGQPTHFLLRRAWGVFTITVPADFDEQRLTWTLVANNQRSEVTFWLNPPYFVDPFLNRANGNVPPRLRVTDGGPELQGPPLRGVAVAFRAVAGEPTRLTAWARDTELEIPPPPRARGRQRPPLSVTWRKYRGPGAVTFDEATYEYESLAGGRRRRWRRSTSRASTGSRSPPTTSRGAAAVATSAAGRPPTQTFWSWPLRTRHRVPDSRRRDPLQARADQGCARPSGAISCLLPKGPKWQAWGAKRNIRRNI